jgi:tRNA uridine 5-carbamoylmethylation protein Kti12
MGFTNNSCESSIRRADSEPQFASLLADSISEKNTRGKLKSAVERAISKRHFIILDSLNNIKGYRYVKPVPFSLSTYRILWRPVR